MEGIMNKLDIKALGLAVGIFWGLYCALLGMVAMLFGCGTGLVELLSDYYVGFKPTLLGSMVGGIWGLVDGFICGGVVAWLYNRLAR